MICIFSDFYHQINTRYDRVRLIKQSPRGRLSLLRHKDSGHRYVLREYEGNAEVYRSLLEIDFPNLPRISEVVEQDGKVAVLEEYIEGNTLAELLEGCLFTPTEAKMILRQLCQGLWVLHDRDLIHRDIKPENIMLEGNRAVLIDFDASRARKSERRADTEVLGTTGYAPPEQYGFSQTDGRADIYALGVLLNIMLTGEHPSGKLAGGRLGRVVQRCTMVAPEKRYRDVRCLLRAL